jgi:hypothetical protein
MDDTLRAHFRNMDLNLQRLAEEGGAERRQLAEDIRNELRLMTRTIAGRSGGGS